MVYEEESTSTQHHQERKENNNKDEKPHKPTDQRLQKTPDQAKQRSTIVDEKCQYRYSIIQITQEQLIELNFKEFEQV